ncbi:hypothetical protein BKA82DRAFT_30907 [Pisolithus tinctorius]|uniref:Uncharacterized protein n=1 Tax=Pisolithus tinctorius Marx 270 TaxID=870435 RepID=A0A0C3NCV5_PISTI|nr:hypothetical protein BKA82DRAFT_30907 [Pisolithus tinctorius]KIN98939.1 hypothetical protein M404DRAFT_30907 [Pisolithus tinctorius Marx 270]
MVPFAFIIYANKMQLSSHGTVKGYPVVVHCANLPVHVHNGEQYGSGCVVGWLPIVPELAKEEGKTGYANFKCVIWHTAFFQLLEKVAELSKVGYLHECYDKVLCWLFPLVLILSADYEELAWPNEKMHGPLKDAYQDCSNGKDIAGQILHVDHHQLATKLIQAHINAENERVNDATNNNEDHNTVLEGNAKLGTPQQTRSLSDVENTNQNHWVFDGFCQKLETFLNTCLPTYGFPLDKWIQLQGTHTIWEYQYLKVQYASMVDWEVAMNYVTTMCLL